jgi:hypothetical protein
LIASLSVLVALSPGCRCTEAPPEPSQSSDSSNRGPGRCPSAPFWAPPPKNVDHLVVELLYPAPKETAREGTGIRIFDDGLVETFDDRVVTIVDRKPKTDPMPAGWRWHAKLPHAELLANVVKVAAEAPAAELSDMQGPRVVPGTKPATLVTVRRGAETLRSCYLDIQLSSSAQQRIEDAAKKVVGDVPLNDPKDPIDAPPPAASSLPKP